MRETWKGSSVSLAWDGWSCFKGRSVTMMAAGTLSSGSLMMHSSCDTKTSKTGQFYHGFVNKGLE